jgi:hypothetical protein
MIKAKKESFTDKFIEKLKSSIKFIFIWTGITLVNASFLVLWVILQWLALQIAENPTLSSLETWILSAFRYVFAATTLPPIIIWNWMEIKYMITIVQSKNGEQSNEGKQYEVLTSGSE